MLWTCSQGHLTLRNGCLKSAHRRIFAQRTTKMDTHVVGMRAGHLEVAKWLYKVGATGDIQVQDNDR